jgi:hypothetical protein
VLFEWLDRNRLRFTKAENLCAYPRFSVGAAEPPDDMRLRVRMGNQSRPQWQQRNATERSFVHGKCLGHHRLLL